MEGIFRMNGFASGVGTNSGSVMRTQTNVFVQIATRLTTNTRWDRSAFNGLPVISGTPAAIGAILGKRSMRPGLLISR